MFIIDLRSRMAIYEQIVSQAEKEILRGLLKPGEQLPSVRALSMELALNPNTVSKAYTELERKGMIYTVVGRGCFVADNAREKLQMEYASDFHDFSESVNRYQNAGIEKEKLIEIIEKIYKGEEE